MKYTRNSVMMKYLLLITTFSVFTLSAQLAPRSDIWRLFGDISYLYWQSGEEGLDLATPASYLPNVNAVFPFAQKREVIFQNFDFGSGFKIGVGAISPCDPWMVRATYTRFHNSTNFSKQGIKSNVATGGILFTNWFFLVSPQQQNIAASKLASKWHLGLDWLDVEASSTFQSNCFSASPFIGFRASWIEQSLNIDAIGVLNIAITDILHSYNNLKSWGIGPRCGIDGKLFLGRGFSIQGKLGSSLLFTRFTNVSHSETAINAIENGISYEIRDYDCVRPMAEANFGFGWGTWLACNRYHIHLAATYDINYLWGQNMLRLLNDLETTGINAGPGDLYLHGLTLTGCFSF